LPDRPERGGRDTEFGVYRTGRGIGQAFAPAQQYPGEREAARERFVAAGRDAERDCGVRGPEPQRHDIHRYRRLVHGPILPHPGPATHGSGATGQQPGCRDHATAGDPPVVENGPGACPAGYREGVPNRIVKRTATLADGRELIYYDDADTRLGPERRIDTRALEPRPPTATMRQDVLNGEWISVAAARQSRVVLPPADRDPLAPQTPDN